MRSKPSQARVAIVSATRAGARLGGELISTSATFGELYVPRAWIGEADERGTAYDGSIRDLLAAVFPRVSGLVVVLPVGACVRLISPLLSDKVSDPAVVAVDDAARFAVSVLSGHRGGANDLAHLVADLLGAEPVISTGSESLGLPALDLLGKRYGWRLDASEETITRVSAAAINGDSVGVCQEAGERSWLADAPEHWPRFSTLEELSEWGGPAIVVSDRAIGGKDAPFRERWVIWRPPSLTIGIGCSSGVSNDELSSLVQRSLVEADLDASSVAVIGTIDGRADEPAVRWLASRLGLPLRTFSAAELSEIDVPNPSPEVARHVGTPGVCEPSAILAAGGGPLVVSKRKSASSTVAIARRRLDEHRPRGRLSLVGLGPGSTDLVTPRARRALRSADLVLGYRGYLDSIASLIPERRRCPFELGQEVERASTAVSLARAGKHVALVSSGDAGVYGMAGIAIELLHTSADGSSNNATVAEPELEVIPGITAANAAASLLGAPLMLDYAVISLSDALVPWSTIKARLETVARSELVVVLYNPAGARRSEPLRKARKILLKHRPASTPVGVVREGYRPKQRVRIVTLESLREAEIDMKTILVVGGATTVRLGDRLVSRRGYKVPALQSSRSE